MVELSVVVPAYQAAALLPACLGGLTAQTAGRARWEVIVVDDASSDEGARIAEAWGATVVRHDRNRGAAAARNSGAAVARGGVLLFLDADVVPDAGIVQAALDLFGDDGVQAATGRYDIEPANDTPFARYKALWTWHCWERTAATTGAASHLQGALAAVRADVLVSAGGFDERYRGGNVEDYELSERLAARGVRIAFDDRLRGRHHFPGAGTVARNYWDRTRMWVRLHRGRGFSSGQASGRTGASALLALAAAVGVAVPPLLPGAALAGGAWIALNAEFLRLLARRSGLPFLAYGAGVHFGLQVVVGAAAVSAPFGRGSRDGGEG